MTLETIYLDCLEAMATHAKTIGSRYHTVVLGAGMAFDAIFQVVFTITYTLMYRLISLLQQYMHVIHAHPLRIFHAFTSLADVELWNQGISRPNGCNGKQ